MSLVGQLRANYPHLTFTAGKTFVWSPETQEIFYNPDRTDAKHRWSLLHETGHALLGHKSYGTDVELLKLEMAAWDKALVIAEKFRIKIDANHIQDCLDTYRDWLHARSICPTCTTKSLQQNDTSRYRCHNCHTTWKVTPSRFARPYRASKGVQTPVTVFHAAESI